MFNQIRKLITKIKGEDIFCLPEDEKYILEVLKEEEAITPFVFERCNNEGKKLLEFLLELTKTMILNYNKNISRSQNKKRIYFFFVDDNEINAFATNIKNIDVIGVNIGVLTKLYDYYNNVVDYNNFPEIEFDLEGRKDLIFNLQVISILYVICHEIGHLYNGHIGFNNLSFIKEIRTFNSNDRSEILLTKTIELDADAFAMTRMLQFNEDLIKAKNNQMDKFYQGDNVLYSYKKLLFSVYSFYLFLGETFSRIDIKQNEYFSPSVRQVLNLTIAEEYISKERPDYKDAIIDFSDYLVRNADFAFDKYNSREKSDKEKKLYLLEKSLYLASPECIDEVLAVQKKWNDIRDDLQTNARIDLAPKYKLKK